jgi:hypothetical protein
VDRLLWPPSGTAVAASTEDVVVLVVVVAISGDDITRNEKKRTNNFRDSRNEKRFSAQCIEHGVAPRVQELFLQQKEEVMMNAGGGEKNEKKGVDASSSSPLIRRTRACHVTIAFSLATVPKSETLK